MHFFQFSILFLGLSPSIGCVPFVVRITLYTDHSSFNHFILFHPNVCISRGCDSFIFLQLLHLGTISEPNQNFSIFFFPFFSPSPNVTWSLSLPCGPIEHCYIPCFHCFMFHHNHFNTEHINNICIFT